MGPFGEDTVESGDVTRRDVHGDGSRQARPVQLGSPVDGPGAQSGDTGHGQGLADGEQGVEVVGFGEQQVQDVDPGVLGEVEGEAVGGRAQVGDVVDVLGEGVAGVFRRGRTLGAGLDRDTLGTAGGSTGQSWSGDRRPTAAGLHGFVPVFNPGPAERRPAERRTPLRVEAGVVDDVQDEEDASGRDGTGYSDESEFEARFHRLVRHLAADGDERAAAAGRKARRTLAEMAPGHVRQPLLTPTSAGREAVR